EECIFSSTDNNIYTFKDYLGNEEVWYIVDGMKPIEYVAKTILICLPQKHHYRSFDKLGTTIQAINSVDYNLLNFVGETTDNNSTSHKIIHICTNMPNEEDGKEGDESVEDVEITEVEVNTEKFSTLNSLTITRRDKRKSVIEKGKPFYSMSTLEFASDYVSKEIINKLINNYKVQLENFMKASSSISNYSTLQGTIFK
ncbi:18494_t:CDS:2, partial [Dentiscutata erythropus]